MGSELLLGPLEGGGFRGARVSGIHRSKVPVHLAQQGQHVTLAVQPPDAPAPEAGATADPAAAALLVASMGADLPLRADSASCLHAWMTQRGSSGAGQSAASSVALDIRGASGHGLAGSRSAAQLGSSLGGQQQPDSLGQPALEHRWGSSPLLTASGGSAASRPRKASAPRAEAACFPACQAHDATLRRDQSRPWLCSLSFQL